MKGEVKIFNGNASEKLAEAICEHLGLKLGESKVGRFSDGEVEVEIKESTRGADVFVIQSTCHPVNENLMELLIMLDALKRASAEHITAVIPYFGYARQDRKVAPRAPISAKLVSNLIAAAGADHVLTTDLHVGQIQGFFDIPVDNLFAISILKEKVETLYPNYEFVVVSPDVGGARRARYFAKRLKNGVSMALIDKRRPAPNVSAVYNVVGDVNQKYALIVDDIVDTAGTLVKGAESLIERGAKGVFAACTHAVLSGPAVERLKKSAIQKLIVTDTVPLTADTQALGDKITVVSVAPLLAEAIKRIHEGKSVSSLFEEIETLG